MPALPVINGYETIHFYHIPRTGGFSAYRFFEKGGTFIKERKKQGKKPIRFSNNGHTRWASKNCPTLIFLRDPAVHVCSLYTYIRSHGAHKGSKFAKERTFSEWLRDIQETWPSLGSFVKFFDPQDGSLEKAIERAELTSFIGFTERFNEDMNTMLKHFELGVKYDNKKHNFSGKRVVPSKSDLAIIRKVRADDYELINSIIKSRNLKPIKFL